MKLPLHNKLFSISLIFLFSLLALFAIFQFQREKLYRTNLLISQLSSINYQLADFINDNYYSPDSQIIKNEIKKIYDNDHIRVTIINNSGKVVFDTESNQVDTFQNHLKRPEIVELDNIERKNAKIDNKLLRNSTYSIRFSSTTRKDYFYVATKFPDVIIRSALPYESDAINLLKTDNSFIYFIIILSIIGLITIWRFSRRIKLNINNLQLFISNVKKSENLDNKLVFPQNELGEISAELIALCKDLIQTKEQLNLEKQKFNYHLQAETEGVAIFSEDLNCIMSNLKFVELANYVLDKVITNPNEIFISNQKDMIVNAFNNNLSSWIIESNNKIIQTKLLKFKDNSFELILNDITKREKIKRFKREITDNLSHELKTPLCSIQGYLESIINRPNISEEQKKNFVNKAFEQSQRMTNLLNDISKITRIDQAKDYFEIEKINVFDMLEKCIDVSKQQITEKNIKIQLDIDENLEIKANEELFLSIFSNLISNSLAYAGEDFIIGISCQIVENNYINFIYYDTGKGVEEKHLNRLFERFYRVDKGRTQKIGGTGLGLAIVNNAVKFHKGNIAARTHESGGLEFVFGWKN